MIKAYYDDFNTMNSPYIHFDYFITRKCFYFVDLTTFYILGQKFVKFYARFLVNLRLSKRHSEIN